MPLYVMQDFGGWSRFSLTPEEDVAEVKVILPEENDHTTLLFRHPSRTKYRGWICNKRIIPL